MSRLPNHNQEANKLRADSGITLISEDHLFLLLALACLFLVLVLVLVLLLLCELFFGLLSGALRLDAWVGLERAINEAPDTRRFGLVQCVRDLFVLLLHPAPLIAILGARRVVLALGAEIAPRSEPEPEIIERVDIAERR